MHIRQTGAAAVCCLFEPDQEHALAAVLNFGIGHERELVLEGEWDRFESPSAGTHSSVKDVALLLKQVHRRGSLQGQLGLSVASECGVLIPTEVKDSGLGGECALIASHSISVLSFHPWARAIGRAQ